MTMTGPVFDNRELAFLVWFLVLLLIGVASRTIRSSLRSILGSLLLPKVGGVFTAIVLYAAGVIWLLSAIGLWTTTLISATLFWVFGPGVALLFRVATADRGSEKFFRKTLADLVKLTVVIEFLINFHSMHLIIELLLVVPSLALLGGLLVLAESQDKWRRIKGWVPLLLLLTVLALLANTIWTIIDRPDEFITLDTLRKFLLPILLTAAFVPFLYVVGLYAAYEKAFVWVNLGTEGNWRARWRAKLALTLGLKGRTSMARALTSFWGKQVVSASSLCEARKRVAEFQVWERERRVAPMREKERLERYAGVTGVGGEGQQLDQREFKETKNALHALATAQMGWYRNRGGRYRTELLDILQSRFERAGLPADHGIRLHVVNSGGAWWAWRRTVTGWCFAIGAKEPPPDEWLYDGPRPPEGPPDEGSAWSEWGIDCKNW